MSKFRKRDKPSPEDGLTEQKPAAGDEEADIASLPPKAKGASGLSSLRLRERLKLPMVSGKSSALMLCACFAMTALIVIPLARKMPPWIEAEIVVASWWVIWAVALSILLHRGWRVSDDHAWGGPRNWLGRGASSEVGDGCLSLGFDFPTFDVGLAGAEGCGEACLGIVAVIAAIGALFVAAWFVIEVAIPGGAFVAYLLIRGMLAKIANDKHGCENSWSCAIAWGVLWATVYIIPQALIVWLIHALAQKAHVG